MIGEGFITPDNVQKKSYFQSKLPSLDISPKSRCRFSAWKNGCDALTVVELHENWTLALGCSAEGGSGVKARELA